MLDVEQCKDWLRGSTLVRAKRESSRGHRDIIAGFEKGGDRVAGGIMIGGISAKSGTQMVINIPGTSVKSCLEARVLPLRGKTVPSALRNLVSDLGIKDPKNMA